MRMPALQHHTNFDPKIGHMAVLGIVHEISRNCTLHAEM
jgi:hypothetical protein